MQDFVLSNIAERVQKILDVSDVKILSFSPTKNYCYRVVGSDGVVYTWNQWDGKLIPNK